jgi:hypothetical protein
MWKNIVQPERPQMTIWRVHIACWMPKAINIPRACNVYCFFTATVVAQTRLKVTLQHTACLILFISRPCPALDLVKKHGLFPCGKAGQIESTYTVEISNTWSFLPLHYRRPRRNEGRQKRGKKKGRRQLSIGTQNSTQIATISTAA